MGLRDLWSLLLDLRGLCSLLLDFICLWNLLLVLESLVNGWEVNLIRVGWYWLCCIVMLVFSMIWMWKIGLCNFYFF